MILDSTLHKLENLQQKSGIKDEDTTFLLNTYTSLKYSKIPGLCKPPDHDEIVEDIGFVAIEILNHPIIYIEMLPNYVVGYTTRKLGSDFLIAAINNQIQIPLELAHDEATILGDVLFMEITVQELNG